MTSDTKPPPDDWSVRRLLIPQSPLQVTLTCGEVATMFEGQDGAPAFAVLDGERVLGLVDRTGFLARFATRFGRSLYLRRSIRHLMDPRPLLVDVGAPLAQVNDLISNTKPRALHTGFIITDNGLYAGLGTGISLMRLLAQQMSDVNEELRRTQVHLVQTEKMASLGGLVAGIAHEINTPIGTALTAITTLDEHLRLFISKSETGRMKKTDLDRFTGAVAQASGFMQSNLGRAAELIQSFKAVAVNQTVDECRRFSLQASLQDILTSLGPRLKKSNHGVRLECPPTVELVSYPGALSQVVTNFVMNALVHAFPEGARGTLTLVVVEPDARTVELRFADDGVGIPAEILPRVFDPFFTTRRNGGGTGLGLHIVYNLITQRLGGRIDVDSVVGRGTVFIVTLPRVV